MATEDYPRSHRVADFIQRELSQLIRDEVKDPRLSPMMTITAVEVSRDLSNAKVHYSLIGAPAGSDEQQDTHDALGSAAGFLRRQLAQMMRTRSVPNLRFYFDDSSERGARMSALIDAAVASNTTDSDEAAGDDTSDSPSSDPRD